VGLGDTRRAAWLIAAAFSAGNQIFCDDSFFKIDKMVDALLLFVRRATKIRLLLCPRNLAANACLIAMLLA